MGQVTVECLHCGTRRTVDPRQAGECPRCRYVGWAHATELDEPARKSLRERPVPARRLRALA